MSKIPTAEEKYKFLLSIMQVENVDFWEGDALLKSSLYFQFDVHNETQTNSIFTLTEMQKDKIVEQNYKEEKERLKDG